MAYRRKQSGPRTATFEDLRSPPPAAAAGEEEQPPSLAAQAIRASSAHRDSSLSSAYGESAYREPNRPRASQYNEDPTSYEYTSMKSLNESKYGFWGVLARKAKSILEDDNAAGQFEDHGRHRPQMLDTSIGGQDQFHKPYRSPESYRKMDNPALQKGSESFASSLNHIGGTIKNALEEGLTIVENRTADIIHETKKLQIRRKPNGSGAQNQGMDFLAQQNVLQSQANQETQLKASRDVASAMAAKAKLLLRELKTVKADLAFAKERCAQLEDENKSLRENRQKGDNPEDDDLIRLQLETLLAEKGRLAHENSVYARENRFLREIVEYHQLTMQDVVYLDEGIEEVSEVSPMHIPNHSPSLMFDAPSPRLCSPSAPPSEPSTPSRNLTVSLEACLALPELPLHGQAPPVGAALSPSPSPTAATARQRHNEDSSPSPSPKVQGSRRQRSSSPV